MSKRTPNDLPSGNDPAHLFKVHCMFFKGSSCETCSPIVVGTLHLSTWGFMYSVQRILQNQLHLITDYKKFWDAKAAELFQDKTIGHKLKR